MADRDGAVARGVSSQINTSHATIDAVTCRQHKIHDVATNTIGAFLKHHIRAVVHTQKSLQDAFDCAEFRSLLRKDYNRGLRIKHGRPPPHCDAYRIGTLDTFMPTSVDSEHFLEDRIVLERYCNGDWERDDGLYDLYVSGSVEDELGLRNEAVEKVPNALCRSFSPIVMSRWKDAFVLIARIGVGYNMNKIFQKELSSLGPDSRRQTDEFLHPRPVDDSRWHCTCRGRERRCCERCSSTQARTKVCERRHD